MRQRFHGFPQIIFALAFLLGPAEGQEVQPEKDPVQLLILAGGASHDFAGQVEILKAGIEDRVDFPIEWSLRLDESGRSDLKHPAIESDSWADGQDLVIHYHCYTRVNEEAYVNQLLAPHRAGMPAIILHSALRSFPVRNDDWARLCGVRTSQHHKTGPVPVTPIVSNHPIAIDRESWISRAEELYRVDQVFPGVMIHAEATEPASESRQPVIWSHEYGPAGTRVFASSLGNRAEGISHPAFLDYLARGVTWALQRSLEEVVSMESSEEPPVVFGADARVALLNPGRSVWSSARASAMSEDVAQGSLAEHLIDGRTNTYWQSGQPGPSVLTISTAEPVQVSAVAVEWLESQPPEYSLEGSLDDVSWMTLATGGAEDMRSERSLYHFPQTKVRSLRLSIPSTRPGERPGIREISAYATKAEIPGAFVVQAGLSDGLRLAEGAAREFNLRLRPDWQPGRRFSGIPAKGDPAQFVECADGTAFLLMKSPEQSASVIRLNRKGRGTVFLEQLEPKCSITWDGEWLFVLEGTRLSKVRDTNGDGAADERQRLSTIFTPDRGDILMEPMHLAIDGWIYVVHKADEPVLGSNSRGRPVNLAANGIARFRRDGSGFQPFVSSSSGIVNFQPDGPLSFMVASAGPKERLVGRELKYGVFPGRPLESFPSLPGGEQLLAARGDFVVPVLNGNKHTPVAQCNGLRAVFATTRGALAFVDSAGALTAIELLSAEQPAAPDPDFDMLRDMELFPLLSAASWLVQQEAVFEILRRKRNWEEEVTTLLQDRNSPSYLPSLALLSQMKGSRTFALLSDAARLSHSAAAFRLLGDREESENHRVFGEITRSTDPVVTTEILAAIARSGSDIGGLKELVLSFAAVEDENLSRTAVEWLVREDAVNVCLNALDGPGTDASTRQAALTVLSSIHRATVAESLVLRLENTRNHEFRKEVLEALCHLYFRRGEVWESTGLIDSFLRASLTDKRVDTAWLLDRMSTHRIPVKDLSGLALAARSSLPLQPVTVELMLAQQKVPDEARTWLREIVNDDSHDASLRAKALSLIIDELKPRDALEKTVGLLRAAIIRAAREALIDSWQRRLKSHDADEITRQIRQSSGIDEDLAQTIPGIGMSAQSDSKPSGDVYEDGFEAFQRLQCGQCHNIHGEGTHLGPDLVQWMSIHGLAELMEAVREPDHEIATGYEAEVFELTSGTVFEGLVKRDDGHTLLIADTAGNLLELTPEEIASTKPSPRSLMPSQIGRIITDQELNSIAYFLDRLGNTHPARSD